jgi:hypothetical protein
MKRFSSFVVLLLVTTPVMVSLMPLVKSDSAETKGSPRKLSKLNYKNEPVKLLDVRVGNKPVKFGEDFEDQDDWLADLSLRFKNNTDKTIAYISVGLRIWDISNPQLRLNFPLTLGRDISFTPPRAPSMPIVSNASFRPQARLLIKFYDDKYLRLKEVTKRLNFNGVGEVKIAIDRVVFEDGTMWQFGTMMYRDPKNPNNWLVADTTDAPKQNKGPSVQEGCSYAIGSENVLCDVTSDDPPRPCRFLRNRFAQSKDGAFYLVAFQDFCGDYLNEGDPCSFSMWNNELPGAECQ